VARSSSVSLNFLVLPNGVAPAPAAAHPPRRSGWYSGDDDDPGRPVGVTCGVQRTGHFVRRLRVSARPQFTDILRAAPPGSVDPALDPDDVFDMLLGAVLARTLIPAVTARRPVERTVEMILRLLRPGDSINVHRLTQ
jgi:hypothetical protein